MAKTTTTRKTTKSKTAASSTARKATKVASTKRSKATAKKPTVKAKSVLNTQIDRLNIISITLFALLAGLTVALMSAVTRQLSLGYLAKDELTGELAPATQAVFDIDLRWIVLSLLVLSAVLPALYLTKFRGNAKELRKSSGLWRYMEIGVTSALMVGTVALLSGINDWATLKVIGGLVVIAVVLAWTAKQNVDSVQKKRLYLISLVLLVLPWFMIAAYALSTVIYGTTVAHWYLYALYAVTIGGLAALAWNEKKVYLQEKRWKDVVFVEQNTVLVGLVTKVLFLSIVIAAFRA